MNNFYNKCIYRKTWIDDDFDEHKFCTLYGKNKYLNIMHSGEFHDCYDIDIITKELNKKNIKKVKINEDDYVKFYFKNGNSSSCLLRNEYKKTIMFFKEVGLSMK